MDAPLYNKLIKYNKNIISFHMPGHKFGKKLDIDKLPLINLDATEVPDLDNLYNAEGIILEAQRKMADKYKAKETIFITGGSTSGIIASILTVCRPGDSLIIARNSHNSVWNGLILGGIRPIYLNPSYDEKIQLIGGIDLIELEKLLIAYPKAKGVLIVSPTYEGIVSDIEKITVLVHKYNKILIVDEAHGAHFVWNKRLPKSALEYGADLVIQSMHKTLPTLTQSALLHIGSKNIDKKLLIQRLQMIQTSSPSYAIMGLMDYIRAYMDKEDNLWEDYLKSLISVRKRLAKLKNMVLLSENIVGTNDIKDIDISKLVILTSSTNITGIELSKILRNKYNIQVELEAKSHIVAISTIADSPEDLDKLYSALMEIDSNLIGHTPIKNNFNMVKSNNKENILPRDVFFGDKEYVILEECEGKVSAANIMVYPPGIPIICIGEIFSKEIIEDIKQCKERLLGVVYKNNSVEISVLSRNII